MDALTRLLEVEQGDAMIVFVRTRQATEEVAGEAAGRGFAAAASTATSLRRCASAPSRS